jgi:hypothetical protein
MAWIFYAMNTCRYKYINLNGLNDITQALSGYILGKSNVYYKIDNETELLDLWKKIMLRKKDSKKHK